MMVIAATKIPVTEVALKIASIIGLIIVQAANASQKRPIYLELEQIMLPI